MADKTLQLKIVVDDSQARASATRRISDEARVEAAVKKAAREQERAQQRATAAAEREAQRRQAIEDKLLLKEYQGRVAAERRKEQEATRAAARIAATREREAEKAANAERRAAEQEARTWKKAWDDEELAKRVHNARIMSANQQRLHSALKAADTEKDAFNVGTAAAEAYATQLKNVVAGLMGFQMIGSVIAGIDQTFKDLVMDAREAAKFTNEYREALLELAALKGRLGETGPEMKENLLFRSKTLQSREAATAFQESALGVGESVIDQAGVRKQISRAEFDKLMTMAGAFQAAEGGSAETHGALAGTIPILMGRRTTAAEAFAKEQQLYNIFKPGGATFTAEVEHYLKNSTLATTGIISPEELAAVQSMFSVSNRTGMGEQTNQFVRATVGGLGRMKGVKVEGESEKVGEYLKRVGATNQMSPAQIGELIAADFAKQEQAATAKGQKFNPMDYLIHHGYGNMEDRQALISFAAGVKSGQWGKTFKPMIGQVPNAREAMKPVEAFQATDLAAQQRKAQIGEELAKVTQGVGQEEYYQSSMRSAFARLKARGEISGEFDDIMQTAGPGLNPFNWGTSFPNMIRQRKIFNEAQAGLQGEASRVGAPLDIGMSGFEAKTHAERAQELYREAQVVGRAGGDIMPGMGELTQLMARQVDATNALTDEMRKAREGRQAGPQAAPARAGGMPAARGPIAPPALRNAPAAAGGARP